MPFRPNVADTLNIDGITYQIAAHPAAPGMPYGQTGRRGTVYQVVDPQRRSQALKVFTQAFRSERTAATAERLRSFASLPGLQVCARQVFTPTSHASLISQHSDLAYAVLMPWIIGDTWQELVMDAQELSRDESHQLASTFLTILATMEQHHLAHCDLAAPNVLVKRDATGVALVDVEELYGPELTRPDKLPGGTPGYAHKTAPAGLWSPEADRFAGAVLLLEMLAWCDPRVRKAAYGEHYFDPDEMQTSSERYDLLRQTIRRHWGARMEQQMVAAWQSETLGDCPSLGEWRNILGAGAAVAPAQPSVVHVEKLSKASPQSDDAVAEAEALLRAGAVEKAISALDALYRTNPTEAAPAYARSLLARAILREEEGQLDLALADYSAVLRMPALQEFRAELAMIVEDLRRETAPVEPPVQTPSAVNGPLLGWNKEALQPALQQKQAPPETPAAAQQSMSEGADRQGKPTLGALRMRGNQALRGGNTVDALICYRIALEMATSDNLERALSEQLTKAAEQLRPRHFPVVREDTAEPAGDSPETAEHTLSTTTHSNSRRDNIMAVVVVVGFIIFIILLALLARH